jgi:hypothetical protein
MSTVPQGAVNRAGGVDGPALRETCASVPVSAGVWCGKWPGGWGNGGGPESPPHRRPFALALHPPFLSPSYSRSATSITAPPASADLFTATVTARLL